MAAAGGNPPPRKSLGRSLNTPSDLNDITLEDLDNPFAFYKVLNCEDPKELVRWLQREGLLNIVEKCPNCGADVALNIRSGD